jgi:hypothetical protein
VRNHRLLSILIAAGIAAGVGAIASTAGAAPDRDNSRLTSAERRLVHRATKAYRDVDAALAAGYVPVGSCTELPGVGGMGIHYLNPALASDTLVDPARPEVLVYVPDRRGSLRLGAVEYFVADADQDLATDTDRPSLFGRHGFDGPMEGHEPGMPIHFDLHVWLYQHNPAGQLEAWNPDVTC